jgi:transcriptional regulator with XRE-family HTH domain
MVSIGDRLRDERKRTSLSQRAFAERGGVTEKTQVLYEKGERVPDAIYLEKIAAAGVDVLFVLTGHRNSAELSPDEEVLVTGYRSLDAKGRAGVLGMISGMTQQGATEPAPAKSSKVRQNFEGANIGQHVTGDVTAPFSINMGTAGRKKKRES